MAEEFIAAAFSPLVLAITSKDADAVCAQNHLSFTEMLQPFCQFTVKKPQYQEPFAIRLVTLKELMRSTVKEAQEVTYGAVSSREIRLPSPEDKLSETLSPQSTPWFNAYCREFLGLVRASDHEFFNRPVACVSVVSTSHPDPVGFLEKSFSVENPPRPFAANTVLDPNLARYFVVLHDGSTGDETVADDILTKMRAKFGTANCSKLVVNTHEGEKEANDGMKDIWQNYVRVKPASGGHRSSNQPDQPASPKEKQTAPPIEQKSGEEEGSAAAGGESKDTTKAADPLQATDPLQRTDASDPLQRKTPTPTEAATSPTPLGPLGARLCMADIKRMRSCIASLGSDCIVPHLESIAAKLGNHIAHTKKSALSSARKWLGLSSSEKKHAAEHKDDPLISNMPVKAAMRRLADVAFTLQDYETAINTYHSVKKEYNHEKSWKDSAGASEMEGLAMYLQSPRRPDPIMRYFEVAFQLYERAQAQIYLCRSTLLAAHVATARGQLLEASIALMKSANEESDLRSALLLEQVAICYTQMKPTREKRAAFHLVLAGHRFVKAGLRQHALRCYMQARSVYRGMEWAFAEDHVNYTVGKQALITGRREDAMEAFTTLLCEHNQQISSQKQYVKDFVQSWKAVNNGVGDGTAELPLPLIVDDKVELRLGGTTGRVTSAAWRTMEAPVLFAARPKRQRVSSMSTFSRDTRVDSHPIAVASETFVLSVVLYNPLRVTIDLRDVQLLGTINNGGEVQPLETHTEASVKILAKTSSTVQLSATPAIPGQIELTGIRFSLSGTVCGCRKFEGKGPRLNATAQHRLNVTYGPDYRLLPLVIPPMPRIEGSLVGVEESLLVGEVINASLTLVNTSGATLFRLFVGASCKGGILTFGSTATIDGNPTDIGMKETSSTTADLEVHVVELELPAGLTAESSISIPVCYTAAPSDVGKQDLMFMVYYEAQQPHARLPYRILKLSHAINVVGSVILSNYVYGVPAHVNQRILRVNVMNTNPQGLGAQLLSIVCDASHWTVEPVQLGPDYDDTKKSVASGETTSLVYRLIRKPESAVGERAVLSLGDTVSVTDGYTPGLERAVAMDSSGDSVLTYQLIWEMSSGNNGDGVVRGFNTSVASLSLVAAGASTAGGQVDAMLRYPESVIHDFSQTRCVRLSATLLLQNNTYTTASGTVVLTNTCEEGAHNPFTWVGRTKITVDEIAPGGVVEMPITALATCSGVYNLAKLVVELKGGDGNVLRVSRVMPALVAVTTE